MPPLNYALVTFMLFSNPESQDPSGPYVTMYEWAYLMPTMKSMAVSMELMDQREVNFCFKGEYDLWPDIQLIRRRNKCLYDAPRVCEALNLPPRETAAAFKNFNREFRNRLAERVKSNQGGWQNDELTIVLGEADQQFAVWSAIYEARSDSYYLTVKREALKKLRILIGDEAYYSHNFPPCVPYWRFSSMD